MCCVGFSLLSGVHWHAGTDLRPILPVLAKVFDQALEGGEACLIAMHPEAL